MTYDPQKAIRQALMVARRQAAYGGQQSYPGYRPVNPLAGLPEDEGVQVVGSSDARPIGGDISGGGNDPGTPGPPGAPSTGNFGRDVAGFAEAAGPALGGMAIGGLMGGPAGAVMGGVASTMAQGLAEATGLSNPASAPPGGFASVAGNIAQTQMGMQPTSNPVDAINAAVTGPQSPADQEDADQGNAQAAADAAAAAAAAADNANSMSEAATADASADSDGGSNGDSGDAGGDGDGGGGGGFARGGDVKGGMDPRSLPGIHLKTNHQFADGGGVQPEEEEEGFDAYHGSPHEFEQFDSSKIGTGEGAQAFGYGHYLAENEGVARQYRNKLAPTTLVTQSGAKHAYSSSAADEIAGDLLKGASPQIRYPVEHALGLMMRGSILDSAISKMRSDYDHFDPKNLDEAERLLRQHNPDPISSGHMYHVRVKAKPEHFLDWDAPLSEQSDHVKNFFGVNDMLQHDLKIDERIKEFVSKVRSEKGKPTDEDKLALKLLEKQKFKPHLIPGGSFAPKNNEEAQKLKAAGIPGIKYFDRDSRSAGEGTRNYVIFDPNMIQVKRRYADGGEIMPQRDLGADPTVQRALDLTRNNDVSPVAAARSVALGETYGGQDAPAYSEAGTEAGRLPIGRSISGGEGILPSSHQAPLEGLPTRVKVPLTGEVITAGPNHQVRAIAEQYMRDAGLPYNPPRKYAKVDPDRGKRIADEYTRMSDDADHPLVKAAYDAMVKETMAQYRAAKAGGLKLEFWNPDKEKDPYEASPRLAIEDVNKNHHMYIFPTNFGFGEKEISPEDIKRNPLLADSGERWNGIPVTVNDLFRAVHDYFGHAKEGVGFRGDGEENAWRSHAAMYSPLARLALTSETRGQNSWLNYGPHGEKNRNARTEDTVFADQKVGVMPPWTTHEGAEDFIRPEDREAIEKIYKKHHKARGGSIGYADGGMPGDDPTVQRAMDLTRQAQPTAPQMARQVQPQARPIEEGDLNAKAVADQPVSQTTEDFNFNIDRGKRKEVKAKLAPEDTQRINKIAQDHKLTPDEVEYSYRKLKNRFPTSQWAPFNIVGVQKDNESVVRDAEGYPELKVQEQAYNFHKPKGAEEQRTGATDWDTDHLNRVTKNIVKSVRDVADREDAGDKNASVIMKARNWYRAMRDRLRQEYGGFADTMADMLGATSAQTGVRQNWDNTIEALSEFSRGSYDRALGKLQSWVDQGGEMGSAAVANGKGYINGHLNDLKAALPDAVKQAKDEGLTNEKQIQKRAKEIAFQKAQEGEFPLITKADGKTLFNANTPAAMMAFLDKFRERKAGDSPKTPNFTGNLIGYSDKATIDLWAARFLRRMAGLKPVPTAAESGVSGSFLAEPLKTGIQVGGEFGFGQQAFQNAAKELRKDPRFAGLGDDDLQAIVWFLEKEHWTKNDWTNKTGEGGSFEQEANFAGVPDRGKLKELRYQAENDTTVTDRQKISDFLSNKAPMEAAKKAFDENKWILDYATPAKQRDAVMDRMGITDKTQAVELAKNILGAAKTANNTIQKYPAAEQRLGMLEQKSQQTRTSATQQLNDMQAVARRFVGGLSPDREENPATPEVFAEGQSALGQAINASPSVIMSKATPSRGRYIDPDGNVYDEKSYDLEFVTRQDFDPTTAWQSIVNEGKRRNQQAVFLSEVVSPGSMDDANPGMEVYFKKKLDDKAVESLTKIINELGVDAGFTFVTDFRSKNRLAGGAPQGEYVGLRLQYIPELGKNGIEGAAEAKKKMVDAIEQISKFDGISNAKYVEYDTQVAMENEYERHLAGDVPFGRRAAWHRKRFGAGNETSIGSQGIPQGSPSTPPVYRRRGGQTDAGYQAQQASLDPVIARALRLTAPDRPMVALADLFQRQLRGRPPS